MHQLFKTHIETILNEHKPKTLLEIGVLRGDSTLQILEWCEKNGAHLTSLDPVAWDGDLPEDVKQPMHGYLYKRGQDGFDDWKITPTGIEEAYRKGLDKYWTCLKTRSLDYLESPDFQGYDAYFIDGDHNYYTVTRELELIHNQFQPGNIIMFNDVTGIWAKKDLYYDPDFIPNEYLNGRNQGVMTAINKFMDRLSEKQMWRRKNCPYQFRMVSKKHNGLGLLTRV